MSWSDKGGAGPSAEVLEAQHREDLERRQRGEPAPIEIGDVRALTSEDINELNERYGAVQTAAAIAAAAQKQLASIKLTTATLPSGTKLMRAGDDSALSADDIDWINTRRLQQAHMAAVWRETNVRQTLLKWTLELTGDNLPRARALLAQIGDDGITKLLKVHKRERRAALARVLEEMELPGEEEEA